MWHKCFIINQWSCKKKDNINWFKLVINFFQKQISYQYKENLTTIHIVHSEKNLTKPLRISRWILFPMYQKTALFNILKNGGKEIFRIVLLLSKRCCFFYYTHIIVKNCFKFRIRLYFLIFLIQLWLKTDNSLSSYVKFYMDFLSWNFIIFLCFFLFFSYSLHYFFLNSDKYFYKFD